MQGIDAGGKARDPQMDDWGAYDQVWDMRFVDETRQSAAAATRTVPITSMIDGGAKPKNIWSIAESCSLRRELPAHRPG